MTSKRMDPRDEIEKQRRRIAIEGLPAAVSALIEVCNSKTAPAPAKATAGTSLLRAAGMFEKPSDALQDKDPAEMTPEELNRAIAEMRAIKPRDDEPESDGESGSVFD